MSDFCLKDICYKECNHNRSIDVTISIFNIWTKKGKPVKHFSLTIILYKRGNDDYVSISTGNQYIDEGIVGDNDKIIEFIKGWRKHKKILLRSSQKYEVPSLGQEL